MVKLLLSLALLAVVSAGCGGADAGNSSGSGGTSGDPTSKFTQTWKRNYLQTTCRQWLNRMTPQQRFAGAADMLTGARDKRDGGTGVPSDNLINEFKRDVDDSCVNPRDKLAVIGAAVYVTERSKYRP